MANLNQEEDTINTIQDVYDGQRTSLYIYLRKVLNQSTMRECNARTSKSLSLPSPVHLFFYAGSRSARRQ